MRVSRQPRQKVLSVKVTEEMREVVEQLAAHLTMKRKQRYTLTDVIEEAILLLAGQEKLKWR